MSQVFYLTSDIVDKEYELFLGWAFTKSSSFSLVWRDQLKFEPSAKSLGRELQQYEIAKFHQNKWPGTELIGGLATVVFYKTEKQVQQVLNRPRRLFGWLSPKFPEDLAFYDAKRNCLLGSISHEKEAYVLSDEWIKRWPLQTKFSKTEYSEKNLTIFNPKFIS